MKVEILFEEAAHEYFVNNRKAKTSVTSLIERQVSKSNFAGVDPIVLANAATRGTNVHKELELFIRDGKEMFSEEGKNFKKHVDSNNWFFENSLTEFKLAIEWVSRNNPNNSFILAGTVDLIATLNTVPIMVDHKTTSVIHKQDVSWQLSLLDYMARKMDGCEINGVQFSYINPIHFYVFHFNKQAQFNMVEVNKISDIEIERLLDAEADGVEYFPLPVDILTPRQQEELLSLEQQIVQLEQAKKELEAKKEHLKRALIEGFTLHPDVTSIRTNSFTISFIPGKEDEVFDSKAFEAENPDMVKKYQRVKITSPQVRITLSKSLKEEIPVIALGGTLALSEPPKKAEKREKIKKGYFGE